MDVGKRFWENVSNKSLMYGDVETFETCDLATKAMAMESDGFPVLELLDMLEIAGWKPVAGPVSHRKKGPKAYDATTPEKKALYYKCLIDSQRLWNDGARPFSSGESQSFFRLLFRKPNLAWSGQTAAEHKRVLASLSAENPITILSHAVRAKREAERPTTAPKRFCIDGDDETPSPKRKTHRKKQKSAAEPAVAQPSAPRAIAVDCDDDDDGEQPHATRPPRPSHIPAKIFTQTVVYDPPRAGRRHARLRVVCDNPSHPGCGRSRSIMLNVANFGARAAEGFLGAWLQASFNMTPEEHRAFTPTLAQMKNYLDMNQG